MTAARWYGAGDIRIESVPVPVPEVGEILVRVDRVGLCGSDLEEYRAGPVGIPAEAVPITLGHEVVGTVIECPGNELPIGTRVVPDVVVGCGTCWWCARHEEGLCPNLRVRGQQQDGGLAEYMLADAATAVVLPDGLELDVAAFAEPCSVAVRALRKAGNLAGSVVCVHGAGTIGLLAAQAALHSSARAVIAVDPVPSRRQLAADAGAVVATPDEAPDVVRRLSEGRGADVVLECAGVPTAPATAVALSRAGASIVLVGFRAGTLELPWLDVVLGERIVAGSAAHLWDVDVAAAVEMLRRGVFDPVPLLSATFTLSAAAQAFAALDRNSGLLKVLIRPEAS
jgi:threonine dehydrogenase-like Zn-dependent dehydrogenase